LAFFLARDLHLSENMAGASLVLIQLSLSLVGLSHQSASCQQVSELKNIEKLVQAEETLARLYSVQSMVEILAAQDELAQKLQESPELEARLQRIFKIENTPNASRLGGVFVRQGERGFQFLKGILDTPQSAFKLETTAPEELRGLARSFNSKRERDDFLKEVSLKFNLLPVDYHLSQTQRNAGWPWSRDGEIVYSVSFSMKRFDEAREALLNETKKSDQLRSKAALYLVRSLKEEPNNLPELAASFRNVLNEEDVAQGLRVSILTSLNTLPLEIGKKMLEAIDLSKERELDGIGGLVRSLEQRYQVGIASEPEAPNQVGEPLDRPNFNRIVERGSQPANNPMPAEPNKPKGLRL